MANSTVTYSLLGLDSLIKNMNQLSDDLKIKGTRFAGRKAANFIAEKARENAERLDDKSTAESIAKNIAVRFSPRVFKQTGNVMYRVGVLGGAAQYANSKQNRRKGIAGQEYVTGGSSTNPGGDTFYWRFIEFGTQKMAARPFMRPALSQNINEATDVFVKNLDAWIARNLKKIGRN